MKLKFLKRLLIATAILASLVLTGCTSLIEEDPADSPVPWATPANWENNVPGMPSSI